MRLTLLVQAGLTVSHLVSALPVLGYGSELVWCSEGECSTRLMDLNIWSLFGGDVWVCLEGVLEEERHWAGLSECKTIAICRLFSLLHA